MGQVTFIKSKKKGLDNLIKGLTKIHSEGVEVGYFDQQGRHYSGYTYAELMALLNWGGINRNGDIIPPRPLMTIYLPAILHSTLKKSSNVRKGAKIWAKNLPKNASPQPLLDAIGEFSVKQGRSLFGKQMFIPNAALTQRVKGRNSPLLDTGLLKSKLTYRTTTDGRVRST